jgi:hypothetical protein
MSLEFLRDQRFLLLSDRCPWNKSTPNGKFYSCRGINEKCCMENCAPLYFVQNGVGKIIYDKLKGSGD